MSGTTEIVEKSAIQLYFTTDEKKFYFSNSGNEVNNDKKQMVGFVAVISRLILKLEKL